MLSAGEIDDFLSSINTSTVPLSSDVSLFVIQRIDEPILGAYHIYNESGGVIDAMNASKILSTNVTAAVIFPTRLPDVTLLRILIIGIPNSYENIRGSNEKIVASSVIAISAERSSLQSTPVNTSLYFQILERYRPPINPVYSCASYDRRNVQWDESGCSRPLYNALFNRYECSCNRLSTFALVWSPNRTSCDPNSYLRLPNGTCISPADALV